MGKSFLVAVLSPSLALFPAPAIAGYVPHVGDYFSYYEVENLGNGTDSHTGYNEQTIVNGTEMINGVSGDEIAARVQLAIPAEEIQA
jgi:voltage-gated potassium channel Kch